MTEAWRQRATTPIMDAVMSLVHRLLEASPQVVRKDVAVSAVAACIGVAAELAKEIGVTRETLHERARSLIDQVYNDGAPS